MWTAKRLLLLLLISMSLMLLMQASVAPTQQATDGIPPAARLPMYSESDCSEPPITTADTLFSCSRGMRFPVTPLPQNSFHTFLLFKKAATTPADIVFAVTVPGEAAALHIASADQVRQYNPGPGTEELYVVALEGTDGALKEDCPHRNGGLPLRGCRTSYGMFFAADTNRDATFDDMQLVFIDGNVRPLNFRILFIPLNWRGTQAQFDAAAQDQVGHLIRSTALGQCPETAAVVTLNVATQNFANFTCTPNSCGVGSIRDFLRQRGLQALVYDAVVGMLPIGASPCWPTLGCSNTTDTLWFEDAIDPIFAHEIGHFYGLADEYCSEAAGGDPRCAGPYDWNFLGADLKCDPRPGQGCCQSCLSGTSNYFACCAGNAGSLGGRCIMTAADRTGTQNWCQRCRRYLQTKAEFSCNGLPTAQVRNVVAIDLDLSSSGKLHVNAVEWGRGRVNRSVGRVGSRFRIVLYSAYATYLDDRFDLLSYNAPAAQEWFNVRYQVWVDFPPDRRPPLYLTVFDGDRVIFAQEVARSDPGSGPSLPEVVPDQL